MRKVAQFVAVALVVVVLWPTSLFGQTETGQIVGTVTDPTGAVVPKAKVTITNLGTAAERTATTNDSGGFVVTNLLPAIYKVTVEASGFAKTERTVQVTVGSRIGLDIALAVGTATQVVEVVGAAGVAINTETQTLGVVIDSKRITELPTLTRNPYDLVGTAGNVSSAQDAGLQKRGAGFNINGLRAAGTNVLLDGASNNDEFIAAVGQQIPLDAVQEFSVLTNNFTAEYGRASAGVVNVATKSGTNDFHGSAYEFNRVSDFASNTFDNNALGIKKPVFVRNQFGYSLGGPVVKDKLFFFQSTEWARVRSSSPTIVYIPTPQLLAASNANTQNFFAGATVRSNAVSLGAFSRNQLIGLGQDPCAGGATTGPCKSFNPNTPMFQKLQYSVPSDSGGGSPQNSYDLVGRVDWIISHNTQLYGRYALESQDFPAGSNVNSVFAGFDTGEQTKKNNFLLSLVHTFSPRVTSQSKIVFNRLNDSQPLGAAPVGPTLYMFSNVPSTLTGNFINFPGYTPFSPGNAIPFGGPQNFLQAYQDINYTKGKHAFRFGGNYVYIRDNRTFGAYEEAVETLSTSNFGQAMDRFFNGVIRQFQVAVDPQGKLPCDNFRDPKTVNPNCSITLPASPPVFSRSNRYHEFGAYAQDSWRISPRFTLNLGVRWDYFGVQHNKNPLLDSNYYDAAAGDIFHSVRQGNISIARLSNVGGLWAKNYHNFAPRLGFAWDVFGNGKTSLRGGYGIGYERNFGNVTFNVIQNPPAYLVVSLIAPTDIPSLPITSNNFGPLAGTSGTQGLPKASMRNVNPHIPTAYAHFYSLSLEREVVKNLIVAVDYSGSKGVNLYSLENPNRTGSGNVYLGDPISGGLTRLRNTQVTNINRRGGNGLSLYNGLNARVDVRNIANSGITLRSNYTYAHAFDNLSSTFSESANNNNLGLLDPFDPKLDRGSADFDVRHRVAVSGTWDLPFARHTTGLVNRVFHGWTVSSIYSAHTGLPFTVFDCTNAFAVCPRAMVPGTRPSKAGVTNVPTGTPNTFNYIDFSKIAFDSTYANSIAGISDFGPFPTSMLPRNYFRGPGAWNLDFAVYKNTKISERFSLQLRAEAYNLPNHSNLYFVPSDNDISSVNLVEAKKGVHPPAIPSVADDRRNLQLAVKLLF
jgi:outer membrane receptor protein involved in Fe transport